MVLAIKICENYGEGWHLPTKDELNCLYKNKDTIGGFTNIYYWSSSQFKNDSYFVCIRISVFASARSAIFAAHMRTNGRNT